MEMMDVDTDSLMRSRFFSFSKNLADRKICPYTVMSMKKNTFNVLEFSDSDFSAGEFLRLCIIESEKLRKKLLLYGFGNYRVTNVLFDEWKSPKELVDWVHWILKVTYTSEALMFGKFVKNVSEKTKRNGEEIAAPCSFISIRETVGKLDYELLDTDFANILRASKPTSKDIFLEKFGRSTKSLLNCPPQESLEFLIDGSGKHINDYDRGR